MKLARLHEEFLDKARRPMTFGGLPVMPREADVPLIPVNKWTKTDGTLKKSYQFRLMDQRNSFVKQLLDHEIEVNHNASISIDEDIVVLKLQTKDIKQITELDKEYAKWADELYKDVVYSRTHDNG